jgi:hypothetical protein
MEAVNSGFLTTEMGGWELGCGISIFDRSSLLLRKCLEPANSSCCGPFNDSVNPLRRSFSHSGDGDIFE